jgi:membrane fusion protein (multidrug efflux system)
MDQYTAEGDEVAAGGLRGELGESEDRRPWARRRVRVLAAGALALAALIATVVHRHYRDRVSTDDAQVDGHITPVSSKIHGTVLDMLVKDNEHVKAGQVLMRIDPRDYQVRVDQARAALALAGNQQRAASAGVPLTQETTDSGASSAAAQLAAAQAEVAKARAEYQRASTADLAYAQANIEARQAANERAQADLARMKPLAAKAEISEQQYDAFLATARMAQSDLQAAREKLAAARHEADMRKEALDAAQARVEQARAAVAQSRANTRQVTISVAQASSAGSSVEQARANLAAAQLQLSYTTILAPIDGVVTRKSVEVGQVLQPGQTLLMLIPLHDVWVTANFKETQLAHVRAGQKAEIKVDMYDRTFTGHVDSIAGATGSKLSLLPPENATGNFVKVVQRIPVKILLDPSQFDGAVLRPGMNVEATIVTK